MKILKKKVRSLFYIVIKPIANRFQFSIESRIGANEIRDFLRKLHPIESIKPLIRLGPDGDGGYLVPDDLKGITACFSPGVDLESRFELDLAERGIDVFLADFSVEKPKLEHPKFHFTKKYIGAMDDGLYISMDKWVSQSLPNENTSDLILQMDIEGFEYETIFSMSQSLINRFRIIVIEFHFLDRLIEKQFYRQVNRIFEKLLSNHSVVHIHPNNVEKPLQFKGIDIPPYLEFTLVRNDRIFPDSFVKYGRNSLDRNNVEKEGVELSKIWYRN